MIKSPRFRVNDFRNYGIPIRLNDLTIFKNLNVWKHLYLLELLIFFRFQNHLASSMYTTSNRHKLAIYNMKIWLTLLTNHQNFYKEAGSVRTNRCGNTILQELLFLNGRDHTYHTSMLQNIYTKTITSS